MRLSVSWRAHPWHRLLDDDGPLPGSESRGAAVAHEGCEERERLVAARVFDETQQALPARVDNNRSVTGRWQESVASEKHRSRGQDEFAASAYLSQHLLLPFRVLIQVGQQCIEHPVDDADVLQKRLEAAQGR